MIQAIREGEGQEFLDGFKQSRDAEKLWNKMDTVRAERKGGHNMREDKKKIKTRRLGIRVKILLAAGICMQVLVSVIGTQSFMN